MFGTAGLTVPLLGYCLSRAASVLEDIRAAETDACEAGGHVISLASLERVWVAYLLPLTPLVFGLDARDTSSSDEDIVYDLSWPS